MKWVFPAKTFLLGEYSAIIGGPALLLTTTPCFEIHLTQKTTHDGIHADSPAGRFWQKTSMSQSLKWVDPYHNKGGLGASSAQFLGAYHAACYLQSLSPTSQGMLRAYHDITDHNQGIRPSGYDLLAQSSHQCLYIHYQRQQCEIFEWPFEELAFILLHTGQKLATHHHLKTLTLPTNLTSLKETVQLGKRAFETCDPQYLIEAVNAYHTQLHQQHLVSKHSLTEITWLQTLPEVLAIKGCGALGADVLLLLVSKSDFSTLSKKLVSNQRIILATHEQLYKQPVQTTNNLLETLEISA